MDYIMGLQLQRRPKNLFITGQINVAMYLFDFVECHYRENKCEISLTKFSESSVNNRGRALNEI